MDITRYYAIENEKPLDNIPADGGFTAIFRTIACVGDSLSSGEFEGAKPDGGRSYHDYFEYSWGQYLARMCGCTVHNFSRGGMTAKEYMESFADYNRFWDPSRAAQAYIVALACNDLFGLNQPVGSIEDVDFADWRSNNTETFAGCYAQILQRYHAIQPRAKFFLMTMPRESHDTPEGTAKKLALQKLLHDFAERFPNTWVLDLYQYAPVYDEKFAENFKLLGHLNPAGYLLTAKMVAAYIDYIIRNNPAAFREVGFIGTELHE